DLGRQRFVEQLDRGLQIAAVGGCHRAFFDVLAGAALDLFHVHHEWHRLWLFHGAKTRHSVVAMLSKGFLELASRMIAGNTVSSNGTKQAADLLQSLWEHAGLKVARQVVDGINVNLLGGPGGEVSRHGGVLLVTHLDTVPPAPGWSTNPFELKESAGFLYGLGVADVKLDALCKAEAARRLQGRKCARPFWLLGTFGEEVGLRGARHFAASDLFAQARPAFVLCGEPSELQVISAHKGYVVVRCALRDPKGRPVSSAGPGIEQ